MASQNIILLKNVDKMMSKKPGPPVPPRPVVTMHHTMNSSIAAAQLAKSSSTTTVVGKVPPTPHGRTVIYKSPSFDAAATDAAGMHKPPPTPRSDDEEHGVVLQHPLRHSEHRQSFELGNAVKRDSFSPKVTTATTLLSYQSTTITTGTSTSSSIVHPTNNDEFSICPTTIKCNAIPSAQCAETRQALSSLPPAPPLRKPVAINAAIDISNPQNPSATSPAAYENIAIELHRSNRRPAETATSAPPAGRLGKGDPKPLDENECAAEEAKQISPVARPRMNAPQMQRRVLKPVNNVVEMQSKINAVGQGHAAEQETLATVETTKNLRNSTYKLVAEKLFTEIAINAQSGQAKLEHCIPVRTPSPPRSQITADRNQTGGTLNKDDQGAQTKSIDGTEKKVTFHEMLISELTGMHSTPTVPTTKPPPPPLTSVPSTEETSPAKEKRCRRYSSSGSADSASSPHGTQRMARIRTADWVEVGDNGKEVLLSSCQISLEDSGLEDEERLDDGSSGVGDSWDSVKDIEDR